MVKLKILIFCSEVTNLQDKGIIFSNIFSYLELEYMPTLFSFSAIFQVTGLEDGIHIFIVTFKNNNSDEIIFHTYDLLINISRNSKIPIEFDSANLTISLNNLYFKTEEFIQ